MQGSSILIRKNKTMNICIQNQTDRSIPLRPGEIRAYIKKAIKICGRRPADPYEMSVVFVDRDEIRAMNRDYRGIDRATDVISFAFQDGEGAGFTPFLLGDMFICPEIVEKHSIKYNSTYRTEMLFVIVHGMLHLLGFDHDTLSERKKMRESEDIIMAGLDKDWTGRNEN